MPSVSTSRSQGIFARRRFHIIDLLYASPKDSSSRSNFAVERRKQPRSSLQAHWRRIYQRAKIDIGKTKSLPSQDVGGSYNCLTDFDLVLVRWFLVGGYRATSSRLDIVKSWEEVL